MKIIFGLGNPGKKYVHNRHNIGYRIVEELAARERVRFRKYFQLSAWVTKLKVNKQDIFLIKPRTYMNNSGWCVGRCLKKYKISPLEALVIYDDVDLNLGEIRFRKKGSSGGHRGLDSIIKALATEEINRLRIGIGSCRDRELADYVLSDFSAWEEAALVPIIAGAIAACRDWINQGADFVMQKYNRTEIPTYKKGN